MRSAYFERCRVHRLSRPKTLNRITLEDEIIRKYEQQLSPSIVGMFPAELAASESLESSEDTEK